MFGNWDCGEGKDGSLFGNRGGNFTDGVGPEEGNLGHCEFVGYKNQRAQEAIIGGWPWLRVRTIDQQGMAQPIDGIGCDYLILECINRSRYDLISIW